MAIADELNELKQTKASIKEKLINKDLEPTDVFSTYPTQYRRRRCSPCLDN